MKHTMKVTILLVLVFLVIQVFGLMVVNADISTQLSPVTGQVTIEHSENVAERPQTEGASSMIYILIGIGLGTVIILILMKLKQVKIWLLFYLFAVWLTISMTFGVFIPSTFAMLFALALAIMKLVSKDIVIHNFTELFIYSGIAVFFAPVLDILWVTVLLILISIYDMFAVWKSKHMVGMAKFQTESKVFAGLMIPYENVRKISSGKTSSGKKVSTAILGGGDIAFPLIFSSVVMEQLVTSYSIVKSVALLKVMIIPIIVSLVLLWLLVKGEKGKFYPAMPFVTIGCLAGYGLLMLSLL
jgi:presenilin-like A22 family membrane protease